MLRWTVHQEGGGWRLFHAAVAVEHQDQVYCFGGLSVASDGPIKYQMKVHVFNAVSLCWRTLPPVTIEEGRERPLEIPSVGRGYTAVLIEAVIYIWGGFRRRRLYAFDVDTHCWLKNETSGTVPKARCHHSACALGKVIYVHGGYNQPTECTALKCSNDMYKLDTATMVWAVINARGTPPPRSQHHSAIINGTKMFVFGGQNTCGVYGGQNTFGAFDDVRVFDTETDLWLDMYTARRPRDFRSHHSAFAYNGELYIIGCRCSNQPQKYPWKYLWKFCPETFSWMKAKLPRGKGLSSTTTSCCCMVGDRVILFGGENKLDDVHILDFSPSLKTLCKLAVVEYDLQQSGLPHNIRWELAAMATNDNTQQEQRSNSRAGNKRKRDN